MSVDRRCKSCGFKFKQEHGPGRKAVNCPTCRKDRQDRWKATQKSGKDKGK
mgnify:CR=1 FL=1